MMSTKMTSGLRSLILDSASKPSTAVATSAPSFFSRVSAVRRMVFESSMTITFSPTRLPWFAISFTLDVPHRKPACSRCNMRAADSQRYAPEGTMLSCEALSSSLAESCAKMRRPSHFSAHVDHYRRADGPHRHDQAEEGHHPRPAAGSAAPRPRSAVHGTTRPRGARRPRLGADGAAEGEGRSARLVRTGRGALAADGRGRSDPGPQGSAVRRAVSL